MSGGSKYEKNIIRKDSQIDENKASAMVSALPQTLRVLVMLLEPLKLLQ